MIIAVDYDGTLEVDGSMNTSLISWLNTRKRAGDRVILWTCRTGNSLLEAIQHSARSGLRFDGINDNNMSQSRKIYADLYIDDKAVNWRKL